MRAYESLFILRPDLEEEKFQAYVDRFSQLITDEGGVIDEVNVWGKRRLAYEIEDHRDGYYVLINFTSEPAVSKELERIQGISEDVLRYMTIRRQS